MARSNALLDLTGYTVPPPHACKPGLSLERQPRWPIVILQLHERRPFKKRAPRFEVVIRPVPPAIPALLVFPPGVRGEEHAVGLERSAQFTQHTRELLAWHMEQRGVGEDAVKVVSGEFQREKILLPDRAAAVLACHCGERRRALEADRLVA